MHTLTQSHEVIKKRAQDSEALAKAQRRARAMVDSLEGLGDVFCDSAEKHSAVAHDSQSTVSRVTWRNCRSTDFKIHVHLPKLGDMILGIA